MGITHSEWIADYSQATNREKKKNTVNQKSAPRIAKQIEADQFRQRQFIELQQKLEQIEFALAEKTQNSQALEVQFKNTQNQLSQQINWVQNLERQLEQSLVKLKQKNKINQELEQQIDKKNEQINTLEQQTNKQKEDLKLLSKKDKKQKSVIRDLNTQLAEQTSLVAQQSKTNKHRNWVIMLLSLLLTIVMA